jgi:hypothetical protein
MPKLLYSCTVLFTFRFCRRLLLTPTRITRALLEPYVHNVLIPPVILPVIALHSFPPARPGRVAGALRGAEHGHMSYLAATSYLAQHNLAAARRVGNGWIRYRLPGHPGPAVSSLQEA